MKCRICGCDLAPLDGSRYDRETYSCPICAENLYQSSQAARDLIEALAARIARLEEKGPAPEVVA